MLLQSISRVRPDVYERAVRVHAALWERMWAVLGGEWDRGWSLEAEVTLAEVLEDLQCGRD